MTIGPAVVSRTACLAADCAHDGAASNNNATATRPTIPSLVLLNRSAAGHSAGRRTSYPATRHYKARTPTNRTRERPVYPPRRARGLEVCGLMPAPRRFAMRTLITAALCAVIFSSSAFAGREPIGGSRLRPQDQRIKDALREGALRSATFRAL